MCSKPFKFSISALLSFITLNSLFLLLNKTEKENFINFVSTKTGKVFRNFEVFRIILKEMKNNWQKLDEQEWI